MSNANHYLTKVLCVFFLSQATGYVFTPTEKEKSDRLLHVRYSVTKDQYCRVSNDSEVTQSWDHCVWSKESVFRKVENDWEMVRLLLLSNKLLCFCILWLRMGRTVNWVVKTFIMHL